MERHLSIVFSEPPWSLHLKINRRSGGSGHVCCQSPMFLDKMKANGSPFIAFAAATCSSALWHAELRSNYGCRS